jgi:hypothetical protein
MQRSTIYPVTPTLSLEADQLRPTWVLEEAVATRLVGGVGAVLSVGGGGSDGCCCCVANGLAVQPCSIKIENDSKTKYSERGRSCSNKFKNLK